MNGCGRWTTYRLRSPGLKQVDHFVTVCAPEKHETILDVGCGTGKATHKLRELGYEGVWGGSGL